MEYPAIPLPPLGPPLAAPNGADPSLPAGDTSGVLPGLERSLLAVLANYRPGDIGICEVGDKLQLTLNLDHWAEWFHYQTFLTPSIDAGANASVTVWTVPTDERAWLDFMYASRASGDNLVGAFVVIPPAGYFEGPLSPTYQVQQIPAGSETPFWPDPGGIQTVTTQAVGPILMEPGSQVQIVASGAGVGASTFNVRLALRRTKLMRAMVP